MELNPSSAESVFADTFTWCHRLVNKQGLNAKVKPNCGVICDFKQTTKALHGRVYRIL